MKQYCYVIVRTDTSDYATRVIANSTEDMDNSSKWQRDHLDALLQKGWRPLREMALGGAGQGYNAYCLVVLERDAPAVVAAAPAKVREEMPPAVVEAVAKDLESLPPPVVEAVEEPNRQEM